MYDSKIFKIPPHSDRYEAVMREAARRAVARMNSDMDTEPEFDAEVDALVTDTEPEFDAEVDALVTVTDLFEALCCVHPTVFSELLGGLITVPAVEPAEDVDDDTEVFYSAEVDKYLSLYGGAIMTVIEMIADEEVVLDSLHIAAVLLKEQPPEVKNLLWLNGVTSEHVYARCTDVLRKKVAEEDAMRCKRNRATTFENITKIREFLLSRCFGQDAVINAIAAQLSIAWGMHDANRGRKPLSFFFVGASGTGKCHLTSMLQEAFETILAIPKIQTIDFSRFSDEKMTIDLIGRDGAWKDGGREGVLTGAAASNPQGIIVIENYEDAYTTAVSYLNTALGMGYMEDAYTKKTVSFARNIFVIITHKKEFAESNEILELISKDGEPPRDKIIEGLVKFEPTFHSTLQQVDAPMLFRKHDFNSFSTILKDRLAALERRFTESYDVKCAFHSEEIFRLLMEAQPSVDSARPIMSTLDATILIPLQTWLMNNYGEFEKRKFIRIECEALPDFDGAPERNAYETFEAWLEERTRRRILQAKRLIFNQEITLTDDAVVLRMKDIAYTMLPSIEDAGYFSVTVPDVSFADLVGVDIVRERASEVIDYFNHPDKCQVRPDTGIILYGPPGRTIPKRTFPCAFDERRGIDLYDGWHTRTPRQRLGDRPRVLLD